MLQFTTVVRLNHIFQYSLNKRSGACDCAADSGEIATLRQSVLIGQTTYDFSQGGDDFAERRQRLVDVGTFLEPGTLGAGGVGPLRTGQIYQRDLAHLSQQSFVYFQK